MPVHHVSVVVPTASFDKAKSWYLAALTPLGYTVVHDSENFAGLAGPEKIPDFWIIAKDDGEPTRHSHFAFAAKDQSQVDKFYEAAIAHGAVDNGKPGIRPYMPNYYAAFVHDDFGNNVEVVHM